MAGFQIEAGTAHGRGFAGADPNGYCSKFYDWVVKSYASGGPNWYLHDDFSAVTAQSFATTDVNTGTEVITVTGHGFANFHLVRFSTTGTLPTGLSTGTDYWLIRVDANTFKVATSLSNALAGTAINLTSQGSGTHTVTPYEYFIVVTDTNSPSANDYDTAPNGGAPKFLRVGYITAEAGVVRLNGYLWWDATNKEGRGCWFGHRVLTYDDADFAYDFRGGAEQMILMARLGTTWTHAMVDDWVGDTNFLEEASKVGVLQSGITAASTNVLQLDTGEAANFTEGNYYYIYDLNGHTWVDYAQCTNVDLVNDQITLTGLAYDFPAGSVVSTYAHRYYCFGKVSDYSRDYNHNMNSVYNNDCYMTMPYISSTTSSSTIGSQSGLITTQGISLSWMDTIIARLIPDDLGYYACQRPSIVEKSANRAYGVLKNLYVSYQGSMAQMLDYRTISGKDWIFVSDSISSSFAVNSWRALLALNTEATS